MFRNLAVGALRGGDRILHAGKGVARSYGARGGQAGKRVAQDVTNAAQSGRSAGASTQQAATRRLASNMRRPNIGRSSGASQRSGGLVSPQPANFGSPQQGQLFDDTPFATKPSSSGRLRSAAGAAMPKKPSRTGVGLGVGVAGFGIGGAMGNSMFASERSYRSGPSINGGPGGRPPGVGRR